MPCDGMFWYGPVMPYPEIVQNTIAGLTTLRSSKPRPRLAKPPGRMASMTASAPATNSRNTAFPSSVRRSSVMLFLPRLMCRCISETPSTIGHVMRRM